jgi:hypothetical protein
MVSWRTGLLCTVVWTVVFSPGDLMSADRAAIVIAPVGSPLWLDPQRAFLFDSPGISLMVRNEHSEPVSYALRIWIFDDEARLRGTVDYCTREVIDRSTRGRVFVPLDIRGVTLRDRAVVAVVAAASAHRSWRLQQSDSDQLAAALSAAKGLQGRLAFDREDVAVDWHCPCDCAAIQDLCDRRCGTRGVVSGCAVTRTSACSASCTC